MAEELQINANDLIAAYGVEVANLTQRAVLAELRAKSLHQALVETRQELANATQASVADGGALSPDEPAPVP